MAEVDPVAVLRMVAAALESLDAVTAGLYVRSYIGEEEPQLGNTQVGVRLVRCDVDPLPRVLGDGDQRAVTVVVAVTIPETMVQFSSGNPQAAVAAVASVLGSLSASDPAVTPDHWMQLMDAEMKVHPEPDVARRVRTGVVMVSGTVRRPAGSSMTAVATS